MPPGMVLYADSHTAGLPKTGSGGMVPFSFFFPNSYTFISCDPKILNRTGMPILVDI